MRVIDASAGVCPQEAIAQARTAAHHLQAGESRTLTHFLTPGDATQDFFVLKVRPDSITVINANQFRITGTSGDTLTWAGGKPPFTVRLWNTAAALTSDMSVNINLDDVGVAGVMSREYELTKLEALHGWWADDLEPVALGGNRQGHIGVQIEDDTGRTIFAPFTPEITYSEDGVTKTGLSAIYAHYGPLDHCEPVILTDNWEGSSTAVYAGEPFRFFFDNPTDSGEFSAPYHTDYFAALIPGTDLSALPVCAHATPFVGWTDAVSVPGTFTFWTDEGCTIDAQATIFNASEVAQTFYVKFTADDQIHYPPVVVPATLLVGKRPQTITGQCSSPLTSDFIGNSHTYTVSWAVGAADSGQAATFTKTVGASLFTVTDLGQRTIAGGKAQDFTITFTGAGVATVEFYRPGTSNFLESNHTSHTTNIKFAAGDGASFAITNTQPITYGGGVTWSLSNSIAGDHINYPAIMEGETVRVPAGWRVFDELDNPVSWAQMFEPNLDGSNQLHLLTAKFHPLDTDTYGTDPWEYDAWLEVGQDTPVCVWTVADDYPYGTLWSSILTAQWYNSHHSGNSSWRLLCEKTYEVTGESGYPSGGIIANMDTWPKSTEPFGTAGIDIVCTFTVNNDSDATPTKESKHKYVEFVDSSSKNTKILKKSVLITPDSGQSGEYGIGVNGNGYLTWGYTGGDLLDGDAFSGFLPNTSSASVGSHDINDLGTLSFGPDYTLSLPDSPYITYSIVKRQLVIESLHVMWEDYVLGFGDGYLAPSAPCFGYIYARVAGDVDYTFAQQITFAVDPDDSTTELDIVWVGNAGQFPFNNGILYIHEEPAGNVTLTASLSLSSTNYETITDKTFTFNPADRVLNIDFHSNLSPTWDGSPKSVTAYAHTADNGAPGHGAGDVSHNTSITFSYLYVGKGSTTYGPKSTDPGSPYYDANAAPSEAGSYDVTATVTTSGYGGAHASCILTINGATATVTLSLPASMKAGETLDDYSGTTTPGFTPSGAAALMTTRKYYTDAGHTQEITRTTPLPFKTTSTSIHFVASGGNYNPATPASTPSTQTKDRIVVATFAPPSQMTPDVEFYPTIVTKRESDGATVAASYTYWLYTGEADVTGAALTAGAKLAVGSYRVTITPTPSNGTPYYADALSVKTFPFAVVAGTYTITWAANHNVTYSAATDAGMTGSAAMTATATDDVSFGDVTDQFDLYYVVNTGTVDAPVWGPLDTTVLPESKVYPASVIFAPKTTAYGDDLQDATVTMTVAELVLVSVVADVITVSGGACFPKVGGVGGYLPSKRYVNGTAVDDGSMSNIALPVCIDQTDATTFKFTVQKEDSGAGWAAGVGSGILFSDLFGRTLFVPFTTSGFTVPQKQAVTLTFTTSPASPVYYLERFVPVVTAKVGGTDIPGSWVYRAVGSVFNATIVSNALLPAGSYTVTATFTPTDTVQYYAAPMPITFVVNPVAPVMAWGVAGIVAVSFTPAAQTVPDASMNATAKHPVSLADISAAYATKSYEYQSGTWHPLVGHHFTALGDVPVRATFTSADPNYAAGVVTATLRITAAALTYQIINQTTVKITGGRAYASPIYYTSQLTGTDGSTEIVNLSVGSAALDGDGCKYIISKTNGALPWNYKGAAGLYFFDQDSNSIFVPFGPTFGPPLIYTQTISAISMSAPVYNDLTYGKTAQIWQTATLSPQNSSAGLPVVFTSSNPSVASVSGRTLICNGIGSCTIYANQPGRTTDPQYSAAAQVSTSFRVIASANYTALFDGPSKPLPSAVLEGSNVLSVMAAASYANIAGTWQYREDSTGGAIVGGGTVFPRSTGKFYYAQFTPADPGFAASVWQSGGLVCTGLVYVRSYKGITDYSIYYGLTLAAAVADTSLVTADNSSGTDIKAEGSMSFQLLDAEGDVVSVWTGDDVMPAGSYYFQAIFTPANSNYQADSDWTGFTVLPAPLTVTHPAAFLTNVRVFGGTLAIALGLAHGNLTFLLNNNVLALSIIDLQKQYGQQPIPAPIFHPDSFASYNVKYWIMQADFSWKQYIDNGLGYDGWFGNLAYGGSSQALFKVSVETSNFAYSESAIFTVTITY